MMSRGTRGLGGVGALAALLLALVACGSAPRAHVKFGASQPGVFISGLSSCLGPTSDPAAAAEIDPLRPLILLIHGCNFSSGGFRTLAAVFAAHNQQTLCFSYNDRDRMEESSSRLATALGALETRVSSQNITILGHSQGGLVARRAFVERNGAAVPRAGFTYRLVTVSSPFGGIASSSDCGLVWLRFASLGVTPLVCQMITGSKWTEIYPGSEFMIKPGTLQSSVVSHLKIVTDEHGTCRRLNPRGTCVEDDEVFSLGEQVNDVVDADARTAEIRVKAGHIEIVGERGNPPAKLLRVLQEHNVLGATPAERREELAALLHRLY